MCPADLRKINGSPCAGGIGSCFNGLCPTRDSQCKFFYGSSSGDGAAGCYTTFNPRGDLHGNCGSTAVANTYRPCATGYVDNSIIVSNLYLYNASKMNGMYMSLYYYKAFMLYAVEMVLMQTDFHSYKIIYQYH